MKIRSEHNKNSICTYEKTIESDFQNILDLLNSHPDTLSFKTESSEDSGALAQKVQILCTSEGIFFLKDQIELQYTTVFCYPNAQNLLEKFDDDFLEQPFNPRDFPLHREAGPAFYQKDHETNTLTYGIYLNNTPIIEDSRYFIERNKKILMKKLNQL